MKKIKPLSPTKRKEIVNFVNRKVSFSDMGEPVEEHRIKRNNEILRKAFQLMSQN